MNTPLRILLIEDSADDVDLLLRELQRGGYQPVWERVDTPETLTAALGRQPWEVITCDYVMPRFSALAALHLIHAQSIDTPIIVVSGEVGEEVAVTAMKAGAADFVSKHRLARLVPAIERELRDAEARRARKHADEERARLIAAVEQAHDAVVITSPDGMIVYVNPAFERMTGYRRTEVYGQHARMLRNGAPEHGVGHDACATIQRGEAWVGHDVQRRKDGSIYRLEAAISPVYAAAGRIINYVGIGHDVTREQAVEAQLREAHKMEAVGRLAGGVAHEFNNQLTVIKGCAQLLLARLPATDAAGRRDADRITAAADKSAGLVRQLLTFSRQHPLDARPLNLGTLVTEMTPTLRLLVGEQITVRVHTTPDLHPVLADRSQMEQLLMHLVANARDAMGFHSERPVGDCVSIESANADADEVRVHVPAADVPPGPYVRLVVSDNGPGMPAHVRQHIFEPFFTTKEPGHGTGLGLATVFGVVQQHRGFITCASEPACGATFRIYIPRHAGGTLQASAAPPRQSAHRAATALQRTVLVAEDEDDVRALLVRALRQAGYEVHSAAAVEEALAQAARLTQPLDLLVTDVVMPGDSGPTLAQRLRQHHPALQVLFISGHLADPLDLAELPGARFLPKPFGLDDLLATVGALLAEAGAAEPPA